MATIILLFVVSVIFSHFISRPVKRTIRVDRYAGIKFERSRKEMAELRSAVYW